MGKQSKLFKLDQEIAKAKSDVDYWALRSTRGKTQKEVAHIDEQFFLAEKNLKELKAQRTEFMSKP